MLLDAATPPSTACSAQPRGVHLSLSSRFAAVGLLDLSEDTHISAAGGELPIIIVGSRWTSQGGGGGEEAGAGSSVLWAEHSFPENKKENRGSPALCVSGNFQGKQRVFGAPFGFSRVSLGKLASFPESESWSGAKSEAKLRKSANYPGIFQVCTNHEKVSIPAKYRYFADSADFGPKIASDCAQTRLRAQKMTILTEFSRENREENRGGCREKRKGKQTGCERQTSDRPSASLQRVGSGTL